MKDISEKRIQIAQSKAAGCGRKEKSRRVQEPPRKDGKCMHLLKNKIKTWKISVESVFPMFALIHLWMMQPVRLLFPDVSRRS